MSNHQRFRRRKLWIDGRIQGAIVLRLLTYYLACGITATCMLVAWRVAVYGVQGGLQNHLAALWAQLGPGALSIILLLPMVLFDSVRLSHRFAGPMGRIRKTMQQATRGEKVARLKLRETDHWQDLANDLNELLEQFGAMKSGTEDSPNDDEVLDSTLRSAVETCQALEAATRQERANGSDNPQQTEELESAAR